MFKRLYSYLLAYTRKPLSAIVTRRYTLTTGNVGELYINGYRVSDTLDTYSENMSTIIGVTRKDEFTNRQSANTLLVDNALYANRRITATVRNAWVVDC